MKKFLGLCALLSIASISQAQVNDETKFGQLEQLLPTPNVYRNAAGAPGHAYWQQQADHDIKVTLDEEKRMITGSETVTYHNNSPEELRYLWVQLDQNVRASNSDSYSIATDNLGKQVDIRTIMRYQQRQEYDGGFKITRVQQKGGKDLPHIINKTMMRIDLPQPLKPNSNMSFDIDWTYNVQDHSVIGGRGGYEYFPADDNVLFEMAQWFPRMAVYDDVDGWQNKQFLGRGEFALAFGDYKVAITVPADHIVASTGVLQNESAVLTGTQRSRLSEARKNERRPVLIVTPEEALKAEGKREKGTKTWIYKADKVRDFAWASSRKFIWDAMNVKVGGKDILAMSYYPKEGNPLWERYSTEAVAHTLKFYSRYTIDYPYPVAISVNGPVGGMEYPMICFNGPRPEADGTYTPRIKYGLISVIIHEVGHNFFPMIINSDERQWTWMDEGLNTFTQFLAEQEWEKDYPSRRGFPANIVPYMSSEKNSMVPIMTNSESIKQFGNNAYGKPATALNILRETVMGRELFDYAFKEYARRWAFKHPMPADFFRTMEDASAVDLDWFWRGWFYTTDAVDISLDKVTAFEIDTKNPDVEYENYRADEENKPPNYSYMLNDYLDGKRVVDLKPELKDFYNTHEQFKKTEYDTAKLSEYTSGRRSIGELQSEYNFYSADKLKYEQYIKSLDSAERALLESGMHFYVTEFSNKGGLVMPIILKLDYTDGTEEVLRIPAEIWKMNPEKVTKMIMTEKEVRTITLDPYQETADIDRENNTMPRQMVPTRFEMYKRQGRDRGNNPMQVEERLRGK